MSPSLCTTHQRQSSCGTLRAGDSTSITQITRATGRPRSRQVPPKATWVRRTTLVRSCFIPVVLLFGAAACATARHETPPQERSGASQSNAARSATNPSLAEAVAMFQLPKVLEQSSADVGRVLEAVMKLQALALEHVIHDETFWRDFVDKRGDVDLALAGPVRAELGAPSDVLPGATVQELLGAACTLQQGNRPRDAQAWHDYAEAASACIANSSDCSTAAERFIRKYMGDDQSHGVQTPQAGVSSQTRTGSTPQQGHSGTGTSGTSPSGPPSIADRPESPEHNSSSGNSTPAPASQPQETPAPPPSNPPPVPPEQPTPAPPPPAPPSPTPTKRRRDPPLGVTATVPLGYCAIDDIQCGSRSYRGITNQDWERIVKDICQQRRQYMDRGGSCSTTKRPDLMKAWNMRVSQRERPREDVVATPRVEVSGGLWLVDRRPYFRPPVDGETVGVPDRLNPHACPPGGCPDPRAQ